MLTADRITELATGKNVRRIAVENFLSTLFDMTLTDALANLEMDKASYGWNHETGAAIHEGIMEHFRD